MRLTAIITANLNFLLWAGATGMTFDFRGFGWFGTWFCAFGTVVAGFLANRVYYWPKKTRQQSSPGEEDRHPT